PTEEQNRVIDLMSKWFDVRERKREKILTTVDIESGGQPPFHSGHVQFVVAGVLRGKPRPIREPLTPIGELKFELVSHGYLAVHRVLALIRCTGITVAVTRQLRAGEHVKRQSAVNVCLHCSFVLQSLEKTFQRRQLACSRRLGCYTKGAGIICGVILEGISFLMRGVALTERHRTDLNGVQKGLVWRFGDVIATR